MNYEKKINRKRRAKQRRETKAGGLTRVAEPVFIDGKLTPYHPKHVLRFRPGTAGVVDVVEVKMGAAVDTLPPIAPRVEGADR